MSAIVGKNKFTYVLLGPAWTRAFRCLWMLEEIHASYELDETVLPQSSRVRALVPSGKLPVLLHYGPDHHHQSHLSPPPLLLQQEIVPPPPPQPLVLYESTAINTYLGEGTSLVPAAGTFQRALYDQTISCISTELDAQGLWLHRKHAALGQVFGEIPDAVAAARTQFTHLNGQIAAQCRPYLLGDTFTAADILYVHCLDWCKSIGWHKDGNGHSSWPPGLDEYRQLCQARPAYQRAQQRRDRDRDQRRQQKQQQQETNINQIGNNHTSKL
jgi:glutathione S-transferase